MNLVGYLITLANLQAFDRSGGPIKDLSIKVGEIQALLNDLQSYPEFQLDNFRQTGYYRDGSIGKYLSKNLRDYVFDGIGNPNDEALVITILFNDEHTGTAPIIVNGPNRRTLSYFLNKGDMDDDVQRGINEYVNNLSYRRHKRAVLKKRPDLL